MLSFTAIAKYTDIPASTINYWHDRGYIIESEEMEPIVKSIIAYLRKQIEDKEQKNDKNNYFAEKTRLTSAQADKIELENAVRQGELLEASECERAWSGLIGNSRARLLAIPSKLAPELAITNDPIAVESRLKSAIYEVLWELSKNFEVESGESQEIIN